MQLETHPNPETVDNPLAVMQPGERIICEIRRTPIGLVGVYFSGALIILAMAVVTILIPQLVTGLTSQLRTLLLAVFALVAFVILLFVYVSATIYKANRWIITSDSITQVLQTGLFRRHSSQLSLANLEDVTADQRGILQSMFSYGTLYAETAGERSKFRFPYCPNPNYYAQQILIARENFVKDQAGVAKATNDRLQLPPNPAP